MSDSIVPYSLAVEEDVALDPVDVRLLGTATVVPGRDGLAHAIEKARLRRVTRAGLAHEEPPVERPCRRCGVYDTSTGGKRDHLGGPSIDEPRSRGKDETVVSLLMRLPAQRRSRRYVSGAKRAKSNPVAASRRAAPPSVASAPTRSVARPSAIGPTT